MSLRSKLFKTMVPALFGVHYAYSGNKSRSKNVTDIIQRDKDSYEKKGESCFLYKYYSSYNPNPYPTDEFDCATINQAFRDKGFKGVLYINITQGDGGDCFVKSFDNFLEGKQYAIVSLDRAAFRHCSNNEEYDRRLYATSLHEATHVVLRDKLVGDFIYGSLPFFMVSPHFLCIFLLPLTLILTKKLFDQPFIHQPAEIAADIGAVTKGAGRDLADDFNDTCNSYSHRFYNPSPGRFDSDHPMLEDRVYYLRRLANLRFFPASPKYFKSDEYSLLRKKHNKVLEQRQEEFEKYHKIR